MKISEHKKRWLELRAKIEKEPADKVTYELVRIMDGVFAQLAPEPDAALSPKEPV